MLLQWACGKIESLGEKIIIGQSRVGIQNFCKLNSNLHLYLSFGCIVELPIIVWPNLVSVAD